MRTREAPIMEEITATPRALESLVFIHDEESKTFIPKVEESETFILTFSLHV